MCTPTTWTPTAWTAGAKYQSPELKDVVQEIVNRGGWTGGNTLALVFRLGTGRRDAVAYEGGAAKAPVLVIEFTPPPPPVSSGQPIIGGLVPVEVSASSGTNAAAASDGDTATAWEGAAGASDWWLMFDLGVETPIADVIVQTAEGSNTNTSFVCSGDGARWTALEFNGTPVSFCYLRIGFAADASGAVHRVWMLQPAEVNSLPR